MSDKTNPNSVGGVNEYSAQRVSLSGPIGITLSPGGNQVRSEAINRNSDAVDKGARSAAFPLGRPNNYK